MIRIAIDGACKGNGKADCISGSGAVVNHDGEFKVFSTVEYFSTNQRGEMYALILALAYCAAHPDDEAQIITDSEYLFNTMTKEWYKSWERRGWLTASIEPVKNQDIWKNIIEIYKTCKIPPMFYHIKGHILPDGGDLAMRTLTIDGPGNLFNLYYDKFNMYKLSKAEQINRAQELSVQNNGFVLDEEILKTFVALNGVADRVAVKALIDANQN